MDSPQEQPLPLSPSSRLRSPSAAKAAAKRKADYDNSLHDNEGWIASKLITLQVKLKESGGDENMLDGWTTLMTPSTLFYVSPESLKFRSALEVIRHFGLIPTSSPKKTRTANPKPKRNQPTVKEEVDSGKQPGTMLKKSIVKPLLDLIGRTKEFDEEIAAITNLFTPSNPPSKILNSPSLCVYDSYFLSPSISVNLVCMYLWCWERMEMYYRKKSYPPNNTEQDKISKLNIFSDYKWCNVYRELDRGTRYLRSQILKPHISDCRDEVMKLKNLKMSKENSVNDPENIISEDLAHPTPESILEILWRTLVYRRANSVWTWSALGGIPSLPKTASEIKKFKDLINSFEGVKEETLNGKFFATCHIDSGGMGKYKSYLNDLLNPVKKGGGILIDIMGSEITEIVLGPPHKNITKAERIFNCITPLKGNGKFFCWQITSDIIEATNLKENYEWMELGPGALSGVERIFFGKAAHKSNRGSYIYKEIKRKFEDTDVAEQKNKVQDICRILVGVQDNVFKHLGIKFRKFRNRGINMKNLEHCLCEFSKYCNMIENLGGAKKTMYEPSGGIGTKSNMDLGRECVVCSDSKKVTGKVIFNETGTDKRICALCAEAFCEGCVEVLGEWRGGFGEEGEWCCPFCFKCEGGEGGEEEKEEEVKETEIKPEQEKNIADDEAGTLVMVDSE